MEPDVKLVLEKLKENSEAELCPTVGVMLANITIYEINQVINQAIHNLTKPKKPTSYHAKLKEAQAYLIQVQRAHQDYEDALNYIVDEILQLGEHPLIQSYRLAGGSLKAEYKYDVTIKYWYIDMISPNRDQPLRIVFGHPIT